MLHHFVVLLLRTQHILKQPNKITLGNHHRGLLITAHGTGEHDTLENHIILCVPIHKLRLQKVNDSLLLHNFKPFVRRYVNHGAKQLHKHISVLAALSGCIDIVRQVLLECLD